MPKRTQPQLSVTLQESHWIAIVDIVLQVCQERGGRWLPWGRGIASEIENAVQRASERSGVPHNSAVDGERREPSHLRDRSASYSEIGDQDRAVLVRRERARAMFRWGYRGTVTRHGDRYVFQVQTAAEFTAGKWPLGDDKGYRGWIQVSPDDQIVAGDCDCPDNDEKRAILPNGVTYCHHMGWAKLKRNQTYEKTVELYFEQGHLLLITENGHIREPRPFETASYVRKRLATRGYRYVRTMGSSASVTRIYRQRTSPCPD